MTLNLTTVKFRNPVTGHQFENYDELFNFVVGELGPAKRHIERLKLGVVTPTPMVVDEISKSILRAEMALSQIIVVVSDKDG